MSSDFEQRLRTRLHPLDAEPGIAVRSDRDLNPDWEEGPESFRVAAVLAGIVKRAGGWTMLLTERATTLALHSGQVAFPGGRKDDGDSSVLDTALRETCEEIGLAREYIEPIGALERYETGTGYRITPIVALIEPGFSLTLAPGEVAKTFETPIDFLMNPANHERHETFWNGKMRRYYAMPYEGHFIWGATAAMIRALYERLYE